MSGGLGDRSGKSTSYPSSLLLEEDWGDESHCKSLMNLIHFQGGDMIWNPIFLCCPYIFDQRGLIFSLNVFPGSSITATHFGE